MRCWGEDLWNNGTRTVCVRSCCVGIFAEKNNWLSIKGKKEKFNINSCNIFDGKPRPCIIFACTVEMDYFFGHWCGGNRLLGSNESLILLFCANLDDLNTFNITGLSSHLSMRIVNNISKKKKNLKANNVRLLKPELFLYVRVLFLCSWRSQEVHGILNLGIPLKPQVYIHYIKGT